MFGHYRRPRHPFLNLLLGNMLGGVSILHFSLLAEGGYWPQLNPTSCKFPRTLIFNLVWYIHIRVLIMIIRPEDGSQPSWPGGTPQCQSKKSLSLAACHSLVAWKSSLTTASSCVQLEAKLLQLWWVGAASMPMLINLLLLEAAVVVELLWRVKISFLFYFWELHRSQKWMFRRGNVGDERWDTLWNTK